MRLACANVSGSVFSGQRMASFDVQVPDTSGQRIELVFHGVRKTLESRVLRISLAADGAPPLVAGQLYTYGEGPPVGAHLRERFAPMELVLDVTRAMGQLRGARHVSVCLDILDPHGRQVPQEALLLEDVELRAEPLE
jgi:hypothetical protein